MLQLGYDREILRKQDWFIQAICWKLCPNIITAWQWWWNYSTKETTIGLNLIPSTKNLVFTNLQFYKCILNRVLGQNKHAAGHFVGL